MVKIFLVILGLTLSLTQVEASQEISVKVLDEAYSPADGGFVAVKILSKGGCGNTTYDIKRRGCSDQYVPKVCFADIKIKSNAVCSVERVSIISFGMDKLNLNDNKLAKTNLVINGTDSKKSQVKVRKE